MTIVEGPSPKRASRRCAFTPTYPKSLRTLVKLGAEGDLSLSGFPGRTFPGQVTNTAVAIDPVSRALLVELQIPNESRELFPGAYAQVTLKLTGETGFYTIPANALLFRAEGAAVGVVHPDGKVEIRKITVNLNQGDKLQISGGLSETDQVIVNPSDSLAGRHGGKRTEAEVTSVCQKIRI